MRVVITRSADKADGMAARLRELGAEPVIFPTIAYAPPEDTAALDAALARLVDGQYDWLVMTSGQVVKAIADRQAFSIPHSAFHIAAVGPATAAACADLLGVQPATVPEQFIAEGLAAALGDLTGKRVLLPKADIGRPTLEKLLRAAGAQVDRVVAYRNIPAPDNGVDMAGMLAAGQIDAVTFTSGSTARAFVQKVGPQSLDLLGQTVIACIGPAAAAVCREIGMEPQVVAEVFTEEGLLESLISYLERMALAPQTPLPQAGEGAPHVRQG
ncbi:uroporphyrinogen-III synthase [Oscillochloris sp. ZM17-4]|uniref:uroporphyrinogen-III synthase n=1 Tax=Oscillochloris sp. ZM17-4 TaxID=2866714 RepID=UPI001C732CD8|nr:uroporphyrinogen-III synthase [Oscillochloris sp. ZM17-4]